VSSAASSDALPAPEGSVQIGDVRLLTRVVGSGPPMIVLHGGPDFDHTYLLPELDRLAQHARLIYYDQRGRGRSADDVRPEDITLASEISDLDGLRRSIGVESVGLIGHSWGGLLAMEYAARHPDRVTRLILLNTAPASHADWVSLGERLPSMRAPGEADRMREIAGSSAFRAGNLDAEAAYYLIHFRPTVPDPQLLRTIVGRLRAHFDPARVRLARAIEDRLYEETSRAPEFDLIPRLAAIDTPTLLIHGEDDLIPIDLARNVADAMPGATMSTLSGLGHFAYAQDPDLVADQVAGFISAG
jgi:proline iminopeptidase